MDATNRVPAPFNPIWGHASATAAWWSRPSAPSRATRAGRRFAVHACLLLLGFMLTMAHLLLRAGLLRPKRATVALRLALRLTGMAMDHWRQGRRDTQA